jgi:3'-phosphoadenosine 5'-phosphosulfate sulfotransferase (PAPS reductase)/FAD synthetase
MIKTHKELAVAIQGKRILHCNSLGKDSVLCLEWLVKQAKVEKIISVFFKFMASHPDDDRYLNYLKKRYPSVEFIVMENPIELNLVLYGIYQTPVFVHSVSNKREHEDFLIGDMVNELKEKYGCDYICRGESKYEEFSRRVFFHQKGLMFQGKIYPIGMFTKEQVYKTIALSGVKLHPMYKFTPSTYDHPSYWKMRNGVVASNKYWKNLLEVYPLMILDKYRYTKLLKGV